MTALETTRITGRIALPDDVSPSNASVRFTLTGFDTDAALDVTVLDQPAVAAVDTSGDIDVELWPTARGVRTRFYNVHVLIRGGVRVEEISLGQISVTDSASTFDLNDLLAVAPPSGATTEDYIAQLAAAVASTDADKTAAAASAAAAASSEANLSLYDGSARWVASPAALIADTALTYTASQPGTVAADDIVQTRDGFAYRVLASGASGEHITNNNATPVKLQVIEPVGGVSIRALGIEPGTTDQTVAVTKAMANFDHVIFDGGEWRFTDVPITREGQVIECRRGGRVSTVAAGQECFVAQVKCHFRFINFDGRGFTDTSGTRSGFVEIAAPNVTIQKSYFYNAQNPIESDRTVDVKGFNISDNLFYDMIAPSTSQENRGAAIFLKASDGIANNNEVWGKPGEKLLHAVKFEALLSDSVSFATDPASRRERIILSNTLINGEFTHGVYPEGMGDFLMIGGHIFGCGSNAIKTACNNAVFANIIAEMVDGEVSHIKDQETVLTDNGREVRFTNVHIVCRKKRRTLADVAPLTDKNGDAVERSKGFVAKARAANIRYTNCTVTQGAPYQQRVVLSTSDTFVTGTNAVNSNRTPDRWNFVSAWDAVNSELTLTQPNGFALVDDVLTQGSATGTVTALEYEMGACHKAFEISGDSNDVEFDGCYTSRDVCEIGLEDNGSDLLTVRNSTFEEPSDDGVRIVGGGSRIVLDTLRVLKAGGNGIFCNAATAISVRNSLAQDCLARGIDIDDCAVDFFDGNTARGNSTSQITFRGTTTVEQLGANIGYVSKARGAGTLANGSTTVNVTHGLAQAPDNVQVTSRVAGEALAVTNENGTNFTVSADSAVGSDVNFYWTAETGV